jgi:hypothetical protein
LLPQLPRAHSSSLSHSAPFSTTQVLVSGEHLPLLHTGVKPLLGQVPLW